MMLSNFWQTIDRFSQLFTSCANYSGVFIHRRSGCGKYYSQTKRERDLICSDEDWDDIVKGFKAAREADKSAQAAIRVFPVDVGKRR